MDHHGEVALQRRTGVTGPWGSARVGGDIPPVAAEFLAAQRLVVLGAADDDGAMWAGPLTGAPGFVRAPDPRTILVDREPVAGDPLAALFDDGERPVGMLAIEPATRRRMRMNGRARQAAGTLVVRTDQVYSNCPKYIQTRTVQDDQPAPSAVAVTRSTGLTADQRAWISGADTFFVATSAPGLGADASHRGGNPGFVSVAGERLTWPDYVGNGMFMTLGNLELDPRAGLLFLDWERGASLQLTGRARVDWNPARAALVPGALRLVDFDVDEVVELTGGVMPRWTFQKYSRFNPA